MLGPAAVANVDANYVKARAKGFVCRGQHVWRRGRAFHAMPHDKRGVLGAVRLPGTTRQASAFGLVSEMCHYLNVTTTSTFCFCAFGRVSISTVARAPPGERCKPVINSRRPVCRKSSIYDSLKTALEPSVHFVLKRSASSVDNP